MRTTALVVLLLAGCKNEGDVGTNDTDDTPGDTETPAASGNHPADLGIGKISVYQGVEAILWLGGQAPEARQAPVIAGRDALVRVFVQPGEAFEARQITAVLTVKTDGRDDVLLEDTRQVGRASEDADLGSTFNFDLTGDQIEESSELGVALVEGEDTGPGGGDEAEATWDSATALAEGLPTGPTDDLTVVIVPIVYEADGSGRMPDTSQARLDELQAAIYKLYPARSVTVRLGEPLPWDRDVGATNSFAWSGLLDAVSNLRGEADELPNTYYYGLFDPADTIQDYCPQGCILGLSSLGFNITNPSLRSSIGVGFDDYAADTIVHEMGHAHGRFHADCGGAAGTDPNYPHPNALIGSWGYDLLDGVLLDPTETTDLMGYCFPMWVSNYTFFGLWTRIAELGAQTPESRLAYTRVTKLRTDGAGHTDIVGTVRVGDPAGGGIDVVVDLFDGAGAPAGQGPGWMFPNSHIPGGVVTLDHVLPAGWSARVR